MAFDDSFGDGFSSEIVTPPEPYPPDLANEMYEELRPLVDTFGDESEHLWVWTQALCSMLQPVDDISKDGPDGEPGWSQIFDLNRAKTEWLPWMGQLVGYQVPARPSGQSLEDYDAEQREKMLTRSSWRRATVERMRDAALENLLPGTARSRVVIQERVAGDPWHIKVWVWAADLLTTAADVETAVRKQKLAELLLDFATITTANYTMLAAANATYAIMKPKFLNYTEVKIDPGR